MRKDKQFLYRLFDRDGQHLYTGITNSPKRRFKEHSQDKPWWNQVDQAVVKGRNSRPKVRSKELRSIRWDDPPFNKADKMPKTFKTSLGRAAWNASRSATNWLTVGLWTTRKIHEASERRLDRAIDTHVSTLKKILYVSIAGSLFLMLWGTVLLVLFFEGHHVAALIMLLIVALPFLMLWGHWENKKQEEKEQAEIRAQQKKERKQIRRDKLTLKATRGRFKVRILPP